MSENRVTKRQKNISRLLRERKDAYTEKLKNLKKGKGKIK